MKRFIITLLILFILALLLQIDDRLQPQAKNWLETVNSEQNSQAYIYLLGIDSGRNDEPSNIGDNIFESIRQYEEDYFNKDGAGEIYRYPDQKKLSLPESDLLCDLAELNCIERILSKTEKAKQLIDANQLLINRLLTFLSFNDFQVLAKPLIDTPIPAYNYLSRANHLYLVQQIISASGTDAAKAVMFVTDHADKLKRYLETSNTMISKMVFASLISDAVDALWIIRNQSGLDNVTLEHLTETEKSMESAFKNEFKFVNLIYQNLDKHPELIEQGGKMPGWSIRLLFKPKMTTNLAFDEYYADYQLSRFDMTEFATAIEKQEPRNQTFFSMFSIRNPVGKILHQVAKPDLKNYIGRLHNLDAKIKLYNEIEIDASGIRYNDLKNPFYKESTPPVFLAKENKICLKPPLEYQQHDICLPVLDPDR